MGRPPMAPEDKRNAQICIRVKLEDRRRMDAKARKQGITVSDLIMRLWRKEH